MTELRSPIESSGGVRLVPTATPGVSTAAVTDAEERHNLPWDRFMRLNAVSEHLRRIIGEKRRVRILDVGGFDGAFAMFVPGHDVDVIDVATTGGSGLRIPLEDRSYELVVSIDAIEHVPAAERALLLSEIARVTAEACFINFPHPATMPAQKLLLSLTGNTFIREHVELGLPDKEFVFSQLGRHGLSCQALPNTSLAQYVSQYALQSFIPDQAKEVSRYLVRAHKEEPFSVPLYLLVIGTR